MILDIAIVTYNRLEKLKKTLLHYEQQTSAFRNLIIVNNCSTDGTSEFLKEYCSQEHYKFQTVLINTDENLGGSGGFYLGQKKALELNADWVMVADDDAYAAPDMVEQFYNFIEHHDSSRISAVCAVVHNIDGSICDYHRRRVTLTSTKGKGLLNKISLDYNSAPVDISEYEKEYFKIDLLSYVGAFLNVIALHKIGLVNDKYFIYCDDSEHSFRLQKFGDIVVVPNMIITHEGGAEGKNNNNVIITWVEYYMTRNHIHTLIHHHPRTVIKKYIEQLRCTIGAWLHHPTILINEKVERDAMWDALWGRLGKHPIYKPGWEVTK